ncbi:hypothetical protein Hanom_Chr13g01221601 [Helianthus anomalus]
MLNWGFLVWILWVSSPFVNVVDWFEILTKTLNLWGGVSLG